MTSYDKLRTLLDGLQDSLESELFGTELETSIKNSHAILNVYIEQPDAIYKLCRVQMDWNTLPKSSILDELYKHAFTTLLKNLIYSEPIYMVLEEIEGDTKPVYHCDIQTIYKVLSGENIDYKTTWDGK